MYPITIEVARDNRFLCLVGAHQIGVVCPDKNKILIGRGSMSVLNNIRYYHQTTQDQPVLVVGDFVESSECSILIGGEHQNSHGWNLAYAGLPVISQIAASENAAGLAHAKGQTIIESNVLLSYGSLVLSGSTIGKGSVVGANAVVSGNVPEKVLWTGNPGKVLRKRFKSEEIEQVYDLIQWEKVKVKDLLRISKLVETGANNDLFEYMHGSQSVTGRIWFDASTKHRRIEIRNMLGVTINDQFISPANLPKSFIDYFKQALGAESTISWVPDAFEYFSIC